MKKLTCIILFILTVAIMLPAIADCGVHRTYDRGTDPEYKITFHNISNETVLFYLYHINHNFNMDRDALPAGGELKAGKSWSVSYTEGGKYYIVWEKSNLAGTLKITKVFVLKEDMDFYYP